MAFQRLALLSLLSLVTLNSVTSSPLRLTPRIAQTIADSTAEWEQACLKAGGALQCNPQSQASFMTLLAAADACDQQDEADKMIDLAKQLNNDADMIKLTQIFVQQPRNSPNSVAIPYCQKEARNSEIQGLFQCQFKGSNQEKFANGQSIGGTGTIPFGLKAQLSPLGSCKANPGGPVDDGQQLVKLVSDPGVGSGAGNSSSGGATATATASSASATETAAGSAPTDGGDTSFPDSTGASNSTSTEGDGDTDFPGSSAADGTDSDSSDDGADSTTTSAGDAATPTAMSAPPSASASSGDFTLQNGKDAQTQNAASAKLTADSSCNEGDEACINGGFAQCVGGKFVIQSCGSTLQCFALPLVNKAGTSLTCTTESDAADRIATTGATGGVTGSDA